MWTIGRSQRGEEKKYRPIVCKLRYMHCFLYCFSFFSCEFAYTFHLFYSLAHLHTNKLVIFADIKYTRS